MKKADTRRIPVVLAATFPREGVAGGLQRAYGQLYSSFLKDLVDFRILDTSIPTDGNLPLRFSTDLKAAWSVLRKGPRGIFHQSCQYGRGIYRDYVLARMARDLGYKTVLDIRAGSFSARYLKPALSMPFYRKTADALLSLVDLVHVQVPAELDFVRKNFCVKDSSLYPNVVLSEHLGRFPPADLSTFPKGPVKVVYAGRAHVHKGILETIDALDIVAREDGLDIEYHLIGGGSPDFARQVTWRKATVSPNLKVIDYGVMEHEEILDILRQCHIYVFASYWAGEGHPNSLNEAMQSGLGLLVSAFQHIPDVVSREGTLLVRPEKVSDIVSGIRYFVEHPDRLREAGAANRRCVEERYLDRKVFGVLLDEYEKLFREMAGEISNDPQST